MKSSKLLGRYVCRLVMALSVSFLLVEASSAANITNYSSRQAKWILQEK